MTSVRGIRLSHVFTDAQHQAFEVDGFVHLPGAVSAEAAAAMRERVWRRLERNGVVRDDPATWRPEHATHLQAIRRGDGAPADSEVVRAALDGVFGEENWSAPTSWGQVLVTFPSEPPWTVPHTIWHLDHPYRNPRKHISGVNLFLFVTDTEPQGGTALVIRSSPQLIARFVAARSNVAGMPQKQARKAFDATHPWLRELTSAGEPETDRVARFMAADTDIDGIPARVVELTGRAGDAVLCHPWAIHCPSKNVLDRPRLMRACRVYHHDFVALRRGKRDQGQGEANGRL